MKRKSTSTYTPPNPPFLPTFTLAHPPSCAWNPFFPPTPQLPIPMRHDGQPSHRPLPHLNNPLSPVLVKLQILLLNLHLGIPITNSIKTRASPFSMASS